jgi:carboxyl-terminal processing protease
MRRFRAVPAVVFAIVVSALVGGLFGRNALATDDKIPDHYRAYSAALNAIESSYVDKVDSEALVTSSIRGMLATLDPHSSYFTPRECADARAAGRPLLRHRRVDSGLRRRRHRDERVRGFAGL